MPDAHLYQPLCLSLVLLASILVTAPFSRPHWKWLFLAVGFQTTNGIALMVPFLFPDLRIGHWNWTGKLLAIIASLCWMWGTGLSRKRVGLRLPTSARGWTAAFVGVLVLGMLSTGERVLAGARPFNTETLAFQAALPGLDEELAYRGLLFALLCKGLPSAHGRALSATIVVILFWLAHVVAVQGTMIRFGGLKPEVLLASIIFMILRLLTGSIVVTTVAHNLDNVANVVA